MIGARTLLVPASDDMVELGRRVGRITAPGDVVVLSGPLGAGKTTFARGLGEALGVRGPVSSPTFVVARTHPSLGDGPALIHVDAYRLSDALELDDLDLDLDAAVTVIEWGREVVGAIADAWLDVELARPRAGEAAGDEQPRRVRVETVGDRWAAPGALAAVDEAIAPWHDGAVLD